MEEYIDPTIDTSIQGIGSFIQLPKVIVQKRRGGLNEITDLRRQVAEMLKISTGQVSFMTKGWTIEQIYEVYNASIKFVNPPALFWKIWKKKKETYGKKINNRTIQKVGKQGRQKDSPERQGTLF